jgi:DNA-directed RNA polymerase II subunit RPB2
MCEALRPSIEEAMMIMTEEDALDYIAKRGAAASYPKDKRITYAMMILESEFLPHVATTSEGLFRKAYFVGYMVSRLIQASLGRDPEDDRDYYGKKRMDMAGSLLSGLFR